MQRKLILVAIASATVVVAAIAFTSTSASHAAPSPRLTTLYGRWVQSGDTCDTPRGDMVIDATSVTAHETGMQLAELGKMRITSVKERSPNTLEVMTESYNHAFQNIITFQLKNPTTILVSPYLAFPKGVWRKCPA